MTHNFPTSIETLERRGTRIRIVVADDHAIFRDCLCGLLATEDDLEVVAQASDGLQAVEALRRYDPDILLLDLHMPEHDGLSALERLQTLRTRTKVIVLTASDEPSGFLQAVRLGTSGIVLKETSAQLLVQSIRRVYAGEVWLDSVPATAVVREFGRRSEPAAPRAPERPTLPAASPERSHLSQREREIVSLVSQGYRNREIAVKAFISEQTVKNHLRNIFDKLGVSDRLELAIYAVDADLQPEGGRTARRM